MLSKALVIGAYQRKAELLGSHEGVELICVVPPAWSGQRLERTYVGGYRLIALPIAFDGNFHLFYFRGLSGVMRQIRPDIVHVDEEPYNLATFLATRDVLAVGARPLFFSWQNLLRRYPPPFRWIERYVFARARHAIAGSDEAAGVLRRKGYDGPLAVIPQFGVDADLFRPAQPGARPSDNVFTVGYAGRLTEEKGLHILLDALAGLPRPWRLRLVGDGPLRASLAARASELNIADRLSFEGAVPSLDMPARLAELDVLVLPSLTRPNWKEQFGRVLQEAMACGVPVVGSDSGEIPCVIGDAGLVVPEGDPVPLRDALDRLAGAAALRAELGRRGRDRVLDRFTHERVVEQTLAVYGELAST